MTIQAAPTMSINHQYRVVEMTSSRNWCRRPEAVTVSPRVSAIIAPTTLDSDVRRIAARKAIVALFDIDKISVVIFNFGLVLLFQPFSIRDPSDRIRVMFHVPLARHC